MWIQLERYENYERWVASKEIVSIIRRDRDVTLWGTNTRLASIEYDTADKAKEMMAKLLELLKISPDADAHAVNVLTYEQEMKLKIADAAIEMREAILAKGKIEDIHLKYLAMYNLIDSLTEWRGERQEGVTNDKVSA